MKKNFYITTPIYYPSGKLHIGNTYTTVFADAIARYHRSLNENVFFLTGTDEHGNKIEKKATALNLEPKEYVDNMAKDIQQLWKDMNITNSKFIRTTDKDHEKSVQAIFETFLKQGDIYKGSYEGWYSVDDEEYFTESQLSEIYKDKEGKTIGGKAPSGHEVELVKEESYFFKMSKYADWLLDYYKNNPSFIEPKSREKEMISNFIKPGLEDLAVTRTAFDWGIKVPSDPKHVIYVWIDALSNYITALGFPDKTTDFNDFWPVNVQLVGKEIVRFHAIYWPIMLHALGLPLPQKILAHGWLTMSNDKMSKSKGNVIYPDTLSERYGIDAVRYYLLKTMPYGNDGSFTPEDFIAKLNYDLANDLGNLLNRTISMVNKYCDGIVSPIEVGTTTYDQALIDQMNLSIEEYKNNMNKYHTADALTSIWKLISKSNKYIDETEPWKLGKNKDSKINSVMAHLVSSLRIIAILIEPVMPETTNKILTQLGIQDNSILISDLSIYDIPNNLKVIEKGTPIFPRVEIDEEIEYIKNKMIGK